MPDPTQIDFCYFDGCEKHTSPTGPPGRIQPTYGELRQYMNRMEAWEIQHTRQPDTDTQLAIIDLVTTAKNWHELFRAHIIAHLAGMVYFRVSDQPGDSEWVWI